MSDHEGLPLLSICIPSYNRPIQLNRLLISIDCEPSLVEIVVCEDAAPRRSEVRQVVHDFRCQSNYPVVYEENPSNLGYDANLRRLIEVASGQFVLFMGDDDWFREKALDQYLTLLANNQDVGYVLRSYYATDAQGTLEPFFYLPEFKRFEPSLNNCAWLYKRSVSIGGVTFRRGSALECATDRFDGTLLYQLYLVLEICSHEPSMYSPVAVAIGGPSFSDDMPQFGTAPSERDRFTPGDVTVQNSINFTKGFFQISLDFDRRHATNITELIRRDLSKYSYPFLSIQRDRGATHFLRYVRHLAQETGLDATWHYYFFAGILLALGRRPCDRGIVCIKRVLGRTPNY